MRERVIYRISHIYRDDFRVRAFLFGQGEKALCVVGNVRGNEYQQTFICSQLIQRLKKLEEEGRFVEGYQVMVIPSVNPSSMNIGKRFWCIDNTDINRMFPGYDLGETTQRIAAGVFDVIKQYRSGVQFTSYYMPGEYQTHVQMLHTGYENPEAARDFGLPYIVLRNPRPFDTATLNYNWQIWETEAYSIYSGLTDSISQKRAETVVESIERFMTCRGILKGTPADVPPACIFHYDELLNIRTQEAGLYHNLVDINEPVAAGQVLAEVIEPCTGEVLETVKSPADGIVFFRYEKPMVYAFTSAVKILKNP